MTELRPKRDAYTQKILDFYKNDGEDKVLEGRVRLAAGMLQFDPRITSVSGDVNHKQLKALLEYLVVYQTGTEQGRAITPEGRAFPVSRPALNFVPYADFSLRSGKGPSYFNDARAKSLGARRSD